MRIGSIDLVQDVVCYLGNFWNLHRFESTVRNRCEVRKLVVESIHKSDCCRILFTKESLDAFKDIVFVVLEREFEEQEGFKELAKVVPKAIERFMRVPCGVLVLALVDLVEEVVELSDVVSQVRRHQRNLTCPSVSFHNEMLASTVILLIRKR